MFPGRDVQLPQGDTGTDHSLRDLIGTADQVMDGRVFGVRSLAEEGAGHILSGQQGWKGAHTGCGHADAYGEDNGPDSRSGGEPVGGGTISDRAQL